MGDEYTPSFDEMKHLIMPSRRDVDFLHSYNNEGYMHRNVIDLEKHVKEMKRNGNGDDIIGQSTDDIKSTDDEDHDHFNWKIIVNAGYPIFLVAEKEWELVSGEGNYEWELV
jgi:hypothetical protein